MAISFCRPSRSAASVLNISVRKSTTRPHEKPGTVIVDTRGRHLYFVEPNGKAIRYGVGIGREGFAWSGRGVIQWKQKWPRWTPPADMVSRQPDIRAFSAENGGMNPGLGNPLGARAMYIFKDGKDTLYRVHGTPDWQSIGKATSSGCVRMLNQDVVDLYNRVPAKGGDRCDVAAQQGRRYRLPARGHEFVRVWFI